VAFAIGHALHSGRARGGDVAVIVAPGAKDWIDAMLPRFREGMQTPRQTVRPLRIAWESRPSEEVTRVLAGLRDSAHVPTDELLAELCAVDDPPPWTDNVIAAVRHQRQACGVAVWSFAAISSLVERRAALHRAHCYSRPIGIPVMSIHGAKNRQFRHVVVLWPHGVRGDARQRRRLLYNAITRAQLSCTVFVRGRELVHEPPFA
jgi:UvrD-like helicase C-terminal domain